MYADDLPQGPANGLRFIPIEACKSPLIGYLLMACRVGDALVVDPPRGAAELILALLEEHGVRLGQVLLTHVHACDPDHGHTLEELVKLCRRSGARLVLGRGSRPLVPDACAAIPVDDGTVLHMGGERIRVLATPGHTLACVSYLWRDRLFCGDVFDLGACAPGDVEAEPGRLFDSLSRIVFALPGETLVFPAHTLKGRRVALLQELRMRCAAALAGGREAFITAMLSHRGHHATGAGVTPVLPATKARTTKQV